MDGVTVLNTYMAWVFGAKILLAVGVLVGGVTIGILIVVGLSNEESACFYFIGVVLSLLIVMFIRMPQREHIQATIDDSVSWTELATRYDVVRVDGKIITMIEKEPKDEKSN